MNKNKYFPTCISNGKAKSIPKYVWNSCCCQKINSQSGWGIGLYCGSITQILVSVTAVRNPLPAEEKKPNCTLFLQRHNIFPQKNNYLNIPAGNLNSLSNLRFLQYVSKDKMKFHNPTPEKNENVFPQKNEIYTVRWPAELYPENGHDFFAMVSNFIPSEQQLYKQMQLFKGFFWVTGKS